MDYSRLIDCIKCKIAEHLIDKEQINVNGTIINIVRGLIENLTLDIRDIDEIMNYCVNEDVEKPALIGQLRVYIVRGNESNTAKDLFFSISPIHYEISLTNRVFDMRIDSVIFRNH